MQPKAADTSCRVILNLWGAVIALPGCLESPVQRQMTKPLTDIEKKWPDEYQQAEESYKFAKEQADLRSQAWREETKKSY
jgi:uncharacterized protein DUF3987